MRFAHQRFPRLAGGTDLAVSHFFGGLFRMVRRAKRLQIGEVKAEVGMRANGLDVIDFQSPARATPDAFPAVAAQCFKTQSTPAPGCVDGP